MLRVLHGEIDPMTALLTRKIGARNMAILMRNVPPY
jgi:putative sterol carrier protein